MPLSTHTARFRPTPRFSGFAVALAVVSTGGLPLLSAAETTPPAPLTPSLYDEGVRALDEGLPPVAVYKLRAFLQTRPSDLARRRETIIALVRALLAVPDPAAALPLLDAEYPPAPAGAPSPDAEITFWRAQTLAASGRWREALDHYTLAAEAAQPPPDDALAAQARFGRGESLLALAMSTGDRKFYTQAEAAFRPLCGHPLLGERARLRFAEITLETRHRKEAIRMLLSAPPAPGSARVLAREHAYLLGRLRLSQRQPALARQIFSEARDHPEGLSERLLVDNYWGIARAYFDEEQIERAQSTLEALIERYPRQSFLAQTFTWLEALYARSPARDLSDLRRWSDDLQEPGRAALARLTLAHVDARGGRAERAEATLAAFGESFPQSPLRVRARLDLAALRLQLGRPGEARAALEQARQLAVVTNNAAWQTGIEVLEARISLAENDSTRAAERFEDVAARLGPTAPQAEAAAFNAALAWMRSDDPGRAVAAVADFQARFPRSALSAEFALEEGLARADRSPPGDEAGRQRATDSLRRFLNERPTHPRAVEARIALVELAFERPRPDVPLAWHELYAPDLQRVANDPANPVEQDRADYLAIWLADAPGPARDPEKAISLAKRLLERRPDSPLAAETRMKLGEIYFAQGDYVAAQTQLELLEKTSPNSPLVEPALYLAGRAASLASQENAVGLLDRAARLNGPFRLPARLRLAELMAQRPGGLKDALTLYDGVLAATARPTLSAPDLEARCAALCGRGQTLLDQGQNTEAAGAFDQLISGTPGASLRWRRQALTLKGHALEKSDPDAALAAYNDALNAVEAPPAAPGEALTPEWTWFYRAGSDAAKLLEGRLQWTAAVAIYKKLAAADGPMRREYTSLLESRRLEHFIWEE